MSRTGRVILPILATVLVVTGIGLAVPATAAVVAHDRVANVVPSAATPHVKNGSVLAFAQVGGTMLVGGSFTSVANPSQSPTYSRNYLFSYNISTGAVSTGFTPSLNGIVNVIIPATDGTSVYVGGSFTSVAGATHRGLVRMNITNGSLVPGFQSPSFNGEIKDMVLAGPRLIVGGTFRTANAIAHGGLASVNPTSGALDAYMGVDVTENHNWPRGTAKGAIQVASLDVTPDQTRLVAIGNFRKADGLTRDQAVMILLQPAAAVVDANWRTRRFEPACAFNRNDMTVREVDISPDGRYFVVVSTGVGYAGTLCDAAGRFDLNTSGDNVQPTWIQATGCDTLLSVEITGAAVYIGGHQKWLNSQNTGCPGNNPQQGQMPRPGLAALDPLNGVPLSWNPGRHPRGFGAEEIYASPTGVYVGSDTDYIGNFQYRRSKLAYFPLAGAPPPIAQSTGLLPANVNVLSPNLGTAANRVVRSFTGTTAGPDTSITDAGINWSTVRGAFMVGNRLFYAQSSGGLYTRTFNGTTFGSAVLIDPYNDPYWNDVNVGGADVNYRGRVPTFYSQLSGITGMYYANGKLYYSKSGQNGLFERGLSLDSLIVEAVERSVPGSTGWSTTNGMFASGSVLYVASSTDGRLSRMALTATGAPTGARTAVSGPGIDGKVWRARALFIGPGGATPPANEPPIASFTASCALLTCSFNATGSEDPDGSIAGYAWNYGDGTTGSGVTSARTYASPGTYTVTLTVTDNAGASASTSRPVSPTTAPATEIAFRGIASTNANVRVATVQVPANVLPGDGLILVLSVNSTANPISAPTGVPGFTPAGSPVSAAALLTRLWQKVAAPGDAGAMVSIDLGPNYIKASLTLLAYAGTSPDGPIGALTSRADPTVTTVHPSPLATAASGNWVLTVWTDKSSTTTAFNPPAGVTLRDRQIGSGSGRLCALVVDSGAPVSGGTVGDLRATTDVGSRATALTIVLTR